MGDPVVYRVSDYELCLRRQEARLIQVTTVEAENRIILQPRPAGRHCGRRPRSTEHGRDSVSTHDTTRHASGQSQHCEQPYDGADCHCGSGSSKTLVAGAPRVALAGAPNAGKTSIYNALTGLHAKTGNYPGVTVARRWGPARSARPA